MKKIFSIIVLFAVCAFAVAQSTMRITKKDGTQIKISVAEIQNICFPDDNSADVALKYYTKYWLHPQQWMQLEALCTVNGEETTADVSWMSTNENVAKVSADGKVTGVADGSCEILATVDENMAAITVNVVTDEQFDVQITNIGNTSCNYSVTPRDNNIHYYCNLRIQSGEYSVDSFEQHGSEEQNMLHFAYDWFAFVADVSGITWQEYMNKPGILSAGHISGDHTDYYSSGLVPGEQYCFYVFGLDEEGNLSTPVEVKKFTTTKPDWNDDLTFGCEINSINSGGATFTITPSDQTMPYFVSVQRESYVQWFVDNDKMSDMVISLVDAFSPSVYPEAYCVGTCTRSTDDFLQSVRPNNDYYVIVFGYDDGQTSDVQLFKLPFTEQ